MSDKIEIPDDTCSSIQKFDSDCDVILKFEMTYASS